MWKDLEIMVRNNGGRDPENRRGGGRREKGNMWV